ncbi:YgaP family membrane protein [Halomicrobium salinisoli]|uniref:YgaP family membrane protein n=1 Tax=Halomicrobium salinisoli TaxID=2878391 RepID=UPI001CEFE14A|nr:DUF2892 domain-containing protein [Halomicrobium salinisoli]
MELQRNLGRLDRIVRGVLGVWLIAGAISAVRDDRTTTAATLAVAGAGLLFNARTGFCGCNAALGIDTTSASVEPAE